MTSDGVMLAIDTNVIVRLVTRDDPLQAERARALIATGDVFVGVTVLLETEWVLRSAYGYSIPQRSGALRAFAGLPRIVLEDASAVATALDLMDEGMDFSDALHLTRAKGCAVMASFDRRFAKVAERLGCLPVRSP